MKVGINYAWKNYAWDFGAPPLKDNGRPWGARAQWKACIDQDLATFVEMGLFCVRWFLLGDGTTYGTEGGRPYVDARDPARWHFDDPPYLTDEFLDDFAELLLRCERAGILLLPSLIDFHFCFPGVTVPGSSGLVKCARSEVVTDRHKRERFFARVLVPLLRIAAARPRALYAFEVMNEPEWCTQPAGTASAYSDPNRTVPLPDMRGFLREGAQLINAAGFPSTVGFAMHQTLKGWDTHELELTLPQFHYYAEPPIVPPCEAPPRGPAIVGELPTAPHRPWPELGPDQSVPARLRLLAQKGYPVAFLWSANREEEHSADPPAVDFSEPNRERIRSYLLDGTE